METAQVNVLGTVNVLEACRVHSVRRFVYASTVYVYSREGGFYRCSKQAAESYVEEYQRAFDLDFTILRYGSLYGPRADASNGLYRIVRDALMRGSISYDGNPESIREYIHVEDAARASVAALGEEFRKESVMLTGHQPMRVLDLLKMLAEIMGLPDSVDFRNRAYAGHYVRTPYAYLPKLGRKYSAAAARGPWPGVIAADRRGGETAMSGSLGARLRHAADSVGVAIRSSGGRALFIGWELLSGGI